MKIFFGNSEGFCIFKVSKHKNYIAHTVSFLISEILGTLNHFIIGEDFFLRRNILGYIQYFPITTNKKMRKNAKFFKLNSYITSYSEKELRILCSYLIRVRNRLRIKEKIKNIRRKNIIRELLF